jgi:hypothetical protein
MKHKNMMYKLKHINLNILNIIRYYYKSHKII